MEITSNPYVPRDGAARPGAALASLWRPARTAPQELPPLSRWAWTADVILAVVLSAATAYATANGGTGDGPFRGPGQVGADGMPLPPLPPVPPPPGLETVYVEYGSPVSVGLVLLAALTALPLVVRRRYPLTAYVTVLATVVAFQGMSAQTWALHGVNAPTVFTFVSLLIAAYAAALYSPYRRRAAVALAIGAVVVVACHRRMVPDIAPSFTPFVLLVPLGLAANTVHTWRQRIRTLEAEQEAATRLAVDQERARIARELHDVVTHNVSMMTVQAGAARTVLDTEPEQARQALLAVESAGRAAMAELRHVMGLLSATTTGPGDPAAGVAAAAGAGTSAGAEAGVGGMGSGAPSSGLGTAASGLGAAGSGLGSAGLGRGVGGSGLGAAASGLGPAGLGRGVGGSGLGAGRAGQGAGPVRGSAGAGAAGAGTGVGGAHGLSATASASAGLGTGAVGVPEAELAPQPGLGQVGVLAERVRGTGVPVDLTVTGKPVELPAGVDLAAYRVAQEALTNTVKHAAGASVTIKVEYRPGEVRIEVADTGGTASPAAGTGNGRGLMGLRERLAVYGGSLDAGRRITGGYRVSAVIPVVDA
jgi:signal transduction histidine kinase